MRPLSLPVVTLAALAALSLSACDKAPADPRLEAPLVKTAIAQPAGVSARAFTGIVAARVQSNLGFRVAGKVTERLVDTGQTVRAGQPLMRIDRTDYVHAITAQTGAAAAAKARMLQAVADEKRYDGLVDAGAVSKSSFDQVKAAADSARAQYDAAMAQLKVAEDEKDYTLLLADSDGTVVDTLVEPGQVVAAGQVVVRLAHAGEREAAINLPETIRPTLGSTAQALVYGGTAEFPARLRQLSDAADPQTRTYEARYVLQGELAKAPLGATVTVRLSMPAVQGVEVPLGAVGDEGQGSGVWVVDAQSSTVSFHKVTIRVLGLETAVIADGLAPGAKIVAMGGHLLRDGQQVRLMQQEARK